MIKMLKVVLLDCDEKFVKFLEEDLISLEETQEKYKIGSIHLKYPITDIHEARNLFRVGYKIWVYGDNTRLKDCLYVINESIKNDYFSNNQVEFDAEDVLTELNNVPYFSQTDLTKSNGFTFESNNESKAVIVNYDALKIWFGEYFDIGIFQSILNSNLEKISPTGTLTKMELLRFIEEETSNVFVTRYEKDPKTNVIHRYLDFLNRKSSNASWKLNFTYYPPREIEDANDFPQANETIQEETYSDGDEVVEIPTQNVEYIDESDFEFRIIQNEEIIESVSAEDMGFTGDSDRYDVELIYQENTLYSTVTGYSYDPTLIDINNLNYQKGSTELDDMIEDSITNNSIECTLSKNVALQLFDTQRERIEYQQILSPILSIYDEDVLDLNHKTENIEYEINESDTFNAIAPILKNDEGTDALTKSQMNTVIQNWINLSVKKGDRVPMIVQKISASSYPSKAQNNPTDYWCKLIKQNELTDGVEFNQATAYWVSPFNKVAGEIYVADDEEVGIEYNQIKGRADISGLPTSTPKIGRVETSYTDKFAIFNDVCMKLKDKRYPELNIEITANNNNYDIFNNVYVKVPGFEKLVTVVVSKTVKNAHDIGGNKVEFNNSDAGTKIISKSTEIIGENKSFKYGSNQNFTTTLYDEDGNRLTNKLMTYSFYKIIDNTAKFVKAYNLKTDSSGVASIPIRLNPGDYNIECTYGGSIEYGSSSSTFKLNVYGTVPKNVTVNTSKTSTSASKKKITTTTATIEKVTNTQKNITGNAGEPIERSSYPLSQTGRLSNSVINTAKSIVGNLEGVAAVKALTLWVAENISFEDRNNFYQTPEKTLSRLRGNGPCQQTCYCKCVML